MMGNRVRLIDEEIILATALGKRIATVLVTVFQSTNLVEGTCWRYET
jgi:hypothetical protein